MLDVDCGRLLGRRGVDALGRDISYGNSVKVINSLFYILLLRKLPQSISSSLQAKMEIFAPLFFADATR